MVVIESLSCCFRSLSKHLLSTCPESGTELGSGPCPPLAPGVVGEPITALVSTGCQELMEDRLPVQTS